MLILLGVTSTENCSRRGCRLATHVWTCEYLEPVEMINVDIVGGDINRELLEERVSTSLDHHLVTELRLHQLLGQSHGGEGEQHVHVGEVLAQRVQEPDVL